MKDLRNLKEGYIIAEIGNNHDGQVSKARELVHAAKESGASSVKFQSINYEDWVTSDLAIFKRAASSGFKTQLERLNSIKLSLDDYISLAELCADLGLDFGCTTFDSETLKALDPYMAYRKVSSGELHNIETLELNNSCNDKSVILSTGLATHINDVKRAWNRVDARSKLVMHCVSQYPTDISSSAMTNIHTLQRVFGVESTGYSDHTVGIDACIFALGMGCRVIEKHFKLDEESDLGDKPLSSTPTEMKRLTLIAKAVSVNSRELGEASEDLECSAHTTASWAQLVRKAHAKRDIKKGEVISLDKCKFVISGEGDMTSFEIEAQRYKLRRDLVAGEALLKEYLEASR